MHLNILQVPNHTVIWVIHTFWVYQFVKNSHLYQSLCLVCRWPRLLPTLEPEYVAKRIVNAILTDQVYLLLPKTLYLLRAIKG